MEEKVCVECNNSIRGRSDKRFCDDACRNSYNNRLNSDQNNYMRKVNIILRKNRRILENHLGKEKMIKINKDQLLKDGFDFDFRTQHLATSKGHNYFYIYEYGYLSLADNKILIVKKEVHS